MTDVHDLPPDVQCERMRMALAEGGLTDAVVSWREDDEYLGTSPVITVPIALANAPDVQRIMRRAWEICGYDVPPWDGTIIVSNTR